MTALVLDAGALVAVERDDRSMMARLRVAKREGLDLRTHSMIVAQVWRDPAGRQARLARFLKSVDVRPIGEVLGRAAGELLATAGSSDPIDAALVLTSAAGDRILTSDPDDMRRLAQAAGSPVVVVAC